MQFVKNIYGCFEIIYGHFERLLTKRNREIYLKCFLFKPENKGVGPSGCCEMLSSRFEMLSGRFEMLSGRFELLYGRFEMLSGRSEMLFGPC